MGAYARDCGIKRLFALGPQSTRAVETFGAGAEWFADADSLIRRVQSEIAPGVTVLVKGSRRQPPGAGGAGPHRRRRFLRPHDESELTVLLYLTEYLARYYTGFHVFQYLTLRGILAAVTALALALFIGPTMIELLARYQIGQRVRTDGPQSHLQKSGTPTMGGGLMLVAMVLGTLLWADLANRFIWILLGDHPGLRPDRFLRRLPEAGGGQFEGPGGALQVPGAIGGGPRGGDDLAPPAPISGRDLAVRALLQDGGRTHVDGGLRGTHLLRDRRHQQCRESHRRPRRPGHHAGRDGGRGAGGLRLRHRQHQVRLVSADSLHPRGGRGADLLRHLGGRRPGVSVVQLLPRRGVHGRCGSARHRRLARHHRGDRAPGNRAVRHGRRVRHGNGVGDAAGGVVQAHGQTNFPHGADSPSLRTEGMGGTEGHRALLDHQLRAGAGGVLQP